MSASAQLIQRLIKENKVMVFSKSYCPFCTKAKNVLNSIGVKYKVLELDEDPNGAEIQNELQAMGEGRTVITIAHRLSTIAHADRIVVLEKGEIVEEGTHDTLLSREGRYASLWHRQAAEDQAA